MKRFIASILLALATITTSHASIKSLTYGDAVIRVGDNAASLFKQLGKPVSSYSYQINMGQNKPVKATDFIFQLDDSLCTITVVDNKVFRIAVRYHAD